MNFGIFFAISFLTNSVSTDLVVVPEPITIQNYDDIISRNVSVITSEVLNEREKFYEQGPDTKEGKISQLFELQDTDPVKLSMLMPRFYQQKMVSVAKPIVAECWALYLLSQTTDPRVRALVVSDHDASKYTSVFMYRKDLHPSIRAIFQRT